MRDLANQNFSAESSKISKSGMRILFLALFVILVLFVARSFVSSLGNSTSSSSSTLRDAPKGLTPVPIVGVNVTEGAVNLTTETARLSQAADVGGSATATRKYGDGSFVLTVNASLPDPDGPTYQVWMVGGGRQANAGFMDGSGSSWSLTFRDTDKEYSSLDTIWITREITNNDGIPEKRILEGSF